MKFFGNFSPQADHVRDVENKANCFSIVNNESSIGAGVGLTAPFVATS